MPHRSTVPPDLFAALSTSFEKSCSWRGGRSGRPSRSPPCTRVMRASQQDMTETTDGKGKTSRQITLRPGAAGREGEREGGQRCCPVTDGKGLEKSSEQAPRQQMATATHAFKLMMLSGRTRWARSSQTNPPQKTNNISIIYELYAIKLTRKKN